jgi:hypothetical protein
VVLLLAFTLPGCGGCGNGKGPNLQNYNKVTRGMTLDEVRGILGEGNLLVVEDMEPGVEAAAGKPGQPIKARVWTNGSTTDEKVIVVLFQDDKVVAKLSKGL